MAIRQYEVLFTRGAEQDLELIYDYIVESDCKANADSVLDRLLEVVENLATFPSRGPGPRSLLRLASENIDRRFLNHTV